MRKILDFLLFTNIFISLCAAAQGWLTYMLLGRRVDAEILLILFFATLFVYNAQAVLNKIPQDGTSVYYRIDWLIRHRVLIRLLSFTAGGITCVLFWGLQPAAKIAAVVTGILAISYSFPLFSTGGLRQIPGLKLFLIAAVWASACVLLPYYESEGMISSYRLVLLWVKRFLFITAITLPFDIRDMVSDKQSGLKTLATVLGEKKAVVLSLLLLGLYLLLLILFRPPSFPVTSAGLLLTVLIAGGLILKSTADRPVYFYLFYFDGILILQPLLVWTGQC